MRILLLGLCLLLSACGPATVRQYADQQPTLDLLRYFDGHVTAWGMYQNRSGEVLKRFTVNIEGRRQGEQLVLDERFLYSDGTRQRRVWTLTPEGNGRWSGQAADVWGAAEGDSAGNALHWRYQLLLPVDGSTYRVSFDDWMFLIDEDTLINRASLRKFGIEWGQVTLFFRRQSGSTANDS